MTNQLTITKCIHILERVVMSCESCELSAATAGALASGLVSFGLRCDPLRDRNGSIGAADRIAANGGLCALFVSDLLGAGWTQTYL
jgi:hypothetical protein